MQKAITTAKSPIRNSSAKSEKLSSSTLNKKKFEVYNKASKAKAESQFKSKPKKAFEYFFNEYDEYLSS